MKIESPGSAPFLDPIGSLVLYGSRARGDHHEGSDVDLFAVATAGPPVHLRHDRVDVSRYPLDHVLGRARSGDLFAFHLVSEGKVIDERGAVFARMKRAFRLRTDYSREIRMASDIGWFLLHHRHRSGDGLRFNQRMAWCAHTIIVARAATERKAVFSAAGLATFAGSSSVAVVIGCKRSPTTDPAVVELFRSMLEQFGTPEPPALATLAAERHRFDIEKNPGGAGAMCAMLSARGGGGAAPRVESGR